MAYIDPNTGGMLFQILAVLLGVFSGVLFFFSRQIKAWFASIRRKFGKKSDLIGNDSIEPSPVSEVQENPADSREER